MVTSSKLDEVVWVDDSFEFFVDDLFEPELPHEFKIMVAINKP